MEEVLTLPMEEEKELISGILSDTLSQRRLHEEKLYGKYGYFVREGAKKYSLDETEAASAYSDAVLQVILNVLNKKFEHRSSLKTYLCRIFINKCVDLVRKNTTHKTEVYRSATVTEELLQALPDPAKNIVQKLIEKQNGELLKQRLSELGDKCRQLLLLFADGYSDKQVAKKAGYHNAAVVKSSRMRCMSRLRELYGLSNAKSEN